MITHGITVSGYALYEIAQLRLTFYLLICTETDPKLAYMGGFVLCVISICLPASCSLSG